ncbi:restriction endonuclease subunit S [Marinagarivorans algicola]|uniref:restriction endonuclease subunit S n=1 Tax=Marinagarivorans algicola TaxID=1513270 RepID=UPI0006B9E1C2|nr:restriction endonuclease subunit S [Marinagarivorans algicola]
MSGKYVAYPEYKDSGVEWLGSIPAHWALKRVKETAILINGYPFDSKKFEVGQGMPLVRIRDIRVAKTEVGFVGKVPAETLINNGDILIGMDGDFNVAQWFGGQAALNQRVACVRAKNYHLQKFIYYVLPFNMRVVNDLTYFTTVKHLSNTDILKTVYTVPPEVELNKIVNFLDHETAKIDTLIAKQQQLITLLKEKRQAVISHAVTKGLNPNAPMRDSGVEWLGEVPEGWGISSLSYYSTISTGATPDRSKPEYWDGDIPWIKTGEVKYDEITETEERITSNGVTNSAVTVSPPGTLLMAMYGQGVTRGRVALLGISATYNQACAAITPNEKIWNEYLRYFFMAAYHAIRDGGNETSQMNLNADIVSKFKVAIPNIDEQHKIVEFLDVKLKSFDALIDKALSAIELMQERRTALISAAVTGKIDVRNWQAPEPSSQKETAA